MLGLAPLTAHNTQALGRSAGNRLRQALSYMHLPGLSHLGTQVVPRGADWLGLRVVPFPGPSSSGVWRARSLRLITFPVSAAQFSGSTTGVPSQEDDDCPEPPEVLANKEACLHFGR